LFVISSWRQKPIFGIILEVRLTISPRVVDLAIAMDFLGLGTSENMLLEAPILGLLTAIRAAHFRIAQPEFKVALVVSSHFHFECHFASLLEFRE
jgi:hypothetical protein